MKILIIDDHPLFREGVGLLLLQLDAGVETVYANSIGEAQAAGLERMCEAYPSVPVVMLVGAGLRLSHHAGAAVSQIIWRDYQGRRGS